MLFILIGIPWVQWAGKINRKKFESMYTLEQIRTAVISKGYAWFDSPTDYDINIVGVRNLAHGDDVTNVFDDAMTVSFKENGVWQYYEWPCTTDPGKKAMLEYHNPKGVAILVPGQYRGAYHIGMHQGKYEAVTQLKPVKVWRDANRDMEYDHDVTDVGIFGINIHRSNPLTESVYVENWSEGCQVFKRVADFHQFMGIVHAAVNLHGNAFTYTLITSEDIS